MTEPAATKPEPEKQEVLTGWAGIASVALKVIAGLTTEKSLTLFVAAMLGWMLYQTMQNTVTEKANERRLYDEAKERDRQHCEQREKDLREWFAAQAELTRRFEAERTDKLLKALPPTKLISP